MNDEIWKCPYGYRSACDICDCPKGPLCGALWHQRRVWKVVAYSHEHCLSESWDEFQKETIVPYEDKDGLIAAIEEADNIGHAHVTIETIK